MTRVLVLSCVRAFFAFITMESHSQGLPQGLTMIYGVQHYRCIGGSHKQYDAQDSCGS